MGRFPVFPRQVCRYNPFGMLRFRTSILTRLSAVSELFGDLLRLVNAVDWRGSSRLLTNYAARTEDYDTAYGPFGENDWTANAELNFTGQSHDNVNPVNVNPV